MAVAPAVRRHHVGEGGSVTDVVDVDAVSDARAIRLRVDEDAADGASRDVDHVVNEPASVREAGVIADQEAEPLLLADLQWAGCRCSGGASRRPDPCRSDRSRGRWEARIAPAEAGHYEAEVARECR